MLSKQYMNVMSYSNSFPLHTEKHTVLGMYNTNCCRTLSILTFKKHLSTKLKASSCFWCNAKAGEVMGEPPVLLFRFVILSFPGREDENWFSSTTLALSGSEGYSILSLPDSSVWVWNHSDTNGSIAGGRPGPCCANKGNDGWHKLSFFFFFF